MRPLTVTSPCCRRGRLLPTNCVSVAPWADVAGRVFGLAAHRADRSSGADERARPVDERGGLCARDEESRGGAFDFFAFVGLWRRRLLLAILLLAFDGFVGDHDQPV